MAGSSFEIHGERIVDGDASTLTALVLYDMGSPNEIRTLGSGERLHITDVIIITETAGDVQLLADSAAVGRYLVDTKSAAGVPIILPFIKPYVCPAGVTPKFKGVSSNRNMCVIHGFIRPA